MDSESIAIAESLRAIGRVTTSLLEVVTTLQGLHTFERVSFSIVPDAEDPSVRVRFFVDAHLREITTRGQSSLGVSLEVGVDGLDWVLGADIGWQFETTPGPAVATDWDYLDVEGFKEKSSQTFFSKLPDRAKAILRQYEDAAKAYG